MAVWGIGASWDGRDVSKDFIERGVAAIGYSEENKATFHNLMRERTKIGDLIFIKAKYNENGQMHIKAIGIISDNNLCKENGFEGHDGIKVRWIKDLTNCKAIIDSPPEYGSTHTMYEEKITSVIRQIIGLI